ncbi:MAG: isochorismatase family protein [Planctomycetaceae bacterium]|jgi:nicotinamidase-related amidase|nr:isochorismatase family protein [Planctomycetaceae bacterium]
MVKVSFLSAAATALLIVSQSWTAAQDWTVHLQKRSKDGTAEKFTEKWNPKETAIIVCDMWSKQTWESCDHNGAREKDMAAAMNKVFAAAREKGMIIVWAPSTDANVFDKWYGHLPARTNSKKYRQGYGNPRHWDFWVHGKGGEGQHSHLAFEGEKDAVGWGGAGKTLPCESKSKVAEEQPPQIKELIIDDRDFITDDFVEMIGSKGTGNGKVDGKEITECLFKERGIKNVIMTGCHTDICVIGRPFGCRALKMAGYNAVLCRDLTNCTINCSNFVKDGFSHVEMLDKVCNYVETYICPTITSTEITGKPAFEFDEEKIARMFPSKRAALQKELDAEKGKMKVEIVKAFYGASESSRQDVTDKILKVFNGSRQIPLGTYNDLFGDPNPGTLKTLWIDYKIDGQGKTQQFAENADIILAK